MAENKKKIWVWSEGNPEFVASKDYIEAGEKYKDIGDFSQFKSIEELRQAIYDLKGWKENRLSIAYWQLMKEVSKGDIVVINNNVAVKGNKYQHNLYGWGEVISDCEYPLNSNNRILRRIKWHKPLLSKPVIANKMTNNIFFHKTSSEEAAQITELLLTNSTTTMNNKKQTYIDLLKANYNIIFNGAPGTGKTYLAKEIAEEMGAKVKMVQFHPSYDYTDFVEGLRPIKDKNGNIGFERKNGVFKEFCKKALEGEAVMAPTNSMNIESTITDVKESENESSPFVFIIDEINRGEISKIFGELFYSIDPGYRGEKGLVQTQYQNLVDENDVFGEGFYVPKNVYIIGTMNDIDRSVDSMDFAMRRRFVWQEITAEESAENMNITGTLWEQMNNLNKVILETEGLGSSYQVGAAMFLKIKKGDMNEEELWNLNLKSLMKEYVRGLPEAEKILLKMEDAYFLKSKGLEDE